MMQSCKNFIASDESIDFFIQYSGNLNETKQLYGAECIQQLDSRYTIAHFPYTDIQSLPYINGTFPRLYGLMDMDALEESGVLRIRRTQGLGLLGQGVLVGIIDTGIDYQNELFKNADNTTRILSIWDQSIQSGDAPEGFEYGSEYTAQQINEALRADVPTAVVPSVDESGHGTVMAAAAAGNIDEENSFSGAAPLSQLVVVKLKPAKQYLRDYYYVRDSAQAYSETDIALGFKYLLRKVMQYGKPMVMCLGCGTTQGGHVGAGVLDEYINNLADIIGICVVVPAGNEGNSRGHAVGTINADENDTLDFELRVGEGERGFALEVWGRSPELYRLTLISPGGERAVTSTTAGNYSGVSEFIFERTVVYADYNVAENRTGNSFVMLRFDSPSGGIWTIRVQAVKGYGGEINMWLPASGFISPDTYFPSATPFVTITDPGNAAKPITVTAYNTLGGSIYAASSRGYSADGRVKPDIAAPGVNISVPLRLDQTGSLGAVFVGTYSGTSISAALTAGACALVLEWGIVRGNRTTLQSTAVKNLLYKGAARRSGEVYPDRTWGYGILNVYESLNSLRTI